MNLKIALRGERYFRSLGWARLVSRILVALCLSVILCASVNADDAADQVVAKVGDHEITEADVDKLIKPRLLSVQNEIYQIKRDAILSLADDYVLEQAAQIGRAHV